MAGRASPGQAGDLAGYHQKLIRQTEIPTRPHVEEALCFEWIDSTLKPIDAACYALRFSPRRKKSYWADCNRARALRLLREGKMTPAGMALLPPEVINAWEEENRPQG